MCFVEIRLEICVLENQTKGSKAEPHGFGGGKEASPAPLCPQEPLSPWRPGAYAGGGVLTRKPEGVEQEWAAWRTR
jgi:hypothetical protein